MGTPQRYQLALRTTLMCWFICIAFDITAGVNSGGSFGRVGSLYSFGSIGSPFATGLRSAGTHTNRTGILEVLIPWHTDSAIQDSDNDGMNDAWETAHGLNPNIANASIDSDHDGLTDYQEFVTGTLPLAPGSRFLATGSVEATGVRLQCTTINGRKYRIEHSIDLVSWTLHDEIIGDGTLLNRLIPTTSCQPRGFYKIIVTMYHP